MGPIRCVVQWPDGANPTIHVTTHLIPTEDTHVRSWPRDLIAFLPGDGGSDTEGTIHTTQRGPRTGVVYGTMTSPVRMRFLYLQHFTSLNACFTDTHTTPIDAVGGEWPLMGFRLPESEISAAGVARLHDLRRLSLHRARRRLRDTLRGGDLSGPDGRPVPAVSQADAGMARLARAGDAGPPGPHVLAGMQRTRRRVSISVAVRLGPHQAAREHGPADRAARAAGLRPVDAHAAEAGCRARPWSAHVLRPGGALDRSLAARSAIHGAERGDPVPLCDGQLVPLPHPVQPLAAGDRWRSGRPRASSSAACRPRSRSPDGSGTAGPSSSTSGHTTSSAPKPRRVRAARTTSAGYTRT